MDLRTRFYKTMFDIPPVLRRGFARTTYNLISRGLGRYAPDVAPGAALPAEVAGQSFMNYGYTDERFEAERLALPPEQEGVRFSIQLYHLLVRDLDLAGKHLLEVGSGRGGGSHYLASCLAPASVVGLELSDKAVEFCNRAYASERLRYLEGDAQAMPFGDASFDVVVNVESSHCYPNFDRFLAEVYRVLRPGGYFCWADARFNDAMPGVERGFALSGLEPIVQRDITANVLRSLELSGELKTLTLDQLPRAIRPMMASAFALPGTTVYKAFQSGHLQYRHKVLRKPADGGRYSGYPFDWSTADQVRDHWGAVRRRFERNRSWIGNFLKMRRPRSQ